VNKPNKKEYQELKEFKLQVGIGLYNAIQLNENHFLKTGKVLSKLDHIVKIDNATFTFYANSDIKRKDIDAHLRKFKTTQW